MAGLAAVGFPTSAAQASKSVGPVLLTISGDITKSNRGTVTPLDQMLVKHSVKFEQALALNAHSLYAMPAVTIKPTLEYDAKSHALSGPLLTTILAAAGVPAGSRFMVTLRAVDGYTVKMELAEAQRLRMVVATHLDGQPLSLGSLGPLWAVFEPDTMEPFKGLPLNQRFAKCPWGLYHIEVATS